MDLKIEPHAESFVIEVGYFDTIRQIKQTIEKHRGIPVSMQTLIFDGKTLADDADVGKCALDRDSNVRLLIADDFFKNLPVNREEFSPDPSTVKLHVNVRTPSSKSRTLQMDANDTVLKLKERIQEIESVPMNHSLVVRLLSKEFHDNLMLSECDEYEHSEIDVSLRPLPVPVPVKGIGNNNDGGGGVSRKFSPAPSTVKLHVNVKTPSSKSRTLQMDANDTVLKLKERIQEIESVPMNHSLVVRLLSKELHDNLMLSECEKYVHSEIDVSLRPLPVPVPVKGIGNNNDGGGGVSRKLRVMVQSMCGNRKIPMEVNPSDKVGELKKELQRLNQGGQLPFPLPSEGYLFICGQDVLDEDKSFRSYQVAQGDTITMFPGRVAADPSR